MNANILVDEGLGFLVGAPAWQSCLRCCPPATYLSFGCPAIAWLRPVPTFRLVFSPAAGGCGCSVCFVPRVLPRRSGYPVDIPQPEDVRCKSTHFRAEYILLTA